MVTDQVEEKGPEGVEEEEDFATMLEAGYVAPVKLRPGQKVEATVVSITPDSLFIDFGRKGEGVIDRKEFADAEGNLTVKCGDAVTAWFVGNVNSELKFSTRLTGRHGGGNSQIEEAFRTGLPVEGLVQKEIKGGFEVRVAGSRAFCPFSQMGLPRVKEEGEYVGKTLRFRVTQYGDRGRNIVISRRALLEEERQGQLDQIKNMIKEGMAVKGTVTSLRDFGAFVDIGGLEGLVPISEVGWGRVDNIRDVLTVGQEVEVVITQLDWVKNRFTFSLKAALADPWLEAARNYPVGAMLQGKVARLTQFGAFVSLSDGIDGLIHISRFGAGRRIKHPNEVVREGQVVEVKVESVDVEKRRIALSLAMSVEEQASTEAGADEAAGYMAQSNDAPAAGSLGSLGEALKAKLDGRE